jgi:hypothetical protein
LFAGDLSSFQEKLNTVNPKKRKLDAIIDESISAKGKKLRKLNDE